MHNLCQVNTWISFYIRVSNTTFPVLSNVSLAHYRASDDMQRSIAEVERKSVSILTQKFDAHLMWNYDRSTPMFSRFWICILHTYRTLVFLKRYRLPMYVCMKYQCNHKCPIDPTTHFHVYVRYVLTLKQRYPAFFIPSLIILLPLLPDK